MKFRRNSNQFISIMVLFLVLLIGIGYAYLSSNLSITGSTNVVGNTWDIHFANLSVKTGSVTASTPAAIQSDTTSINYSVDLERPGDFYEFEVDIVNSGTLPGKVGLVNITGISSSVEEYLESSIKYINGNPVEVDDLLNPSATKRIVVRVGYKEDLNSLPEDDIELDLVFNATFTQTTEIEINAGNLLQNLAADNSCIYKYTGSVTDSVGVTTPIATNVYYDRCADKRNVIFGGFCWQIIRTTETGGLKMIYNGEPVDGKCESTRGDHTGIIGTTGSTQNLASEYLYGATFIYNTTTSEFTLVDTISAIWSSSTYQNLLGKFTCKNTSGTCTTLYSVNGYSDATTAYTSSYTIGDTNYAQIGTSAYNANSNNPAMVGYMFNKVYSYVSSGAPTSGSLMGNDVLYSNGTYTLLPADGEASLGTTKDATHHYTCNTTASTCSKVRYYYYNNYYIELDGAENIQAAVNEMLYNNDVNTYNSSIKGIIDSWYAQNLSTKTSMLEDTVFCNARNMTNQSTNGWNKDGSLSTYMYFKNDVLSDDISCANETDQFAVGNISAKLTYPVSLATHEELYTLTNNNSFTYYDVFTKTGVWWWGLSPFCFNLSNARVRYVNNSGDVKNANSVSGAGGVRLVVSLAPGNVISSGDGSETRPWIIG